MKITGIVFVILGLFSLIYYNCSDVYVDSSGVLHEPFFLLPAGTVLSVLGAILLLYYSITRRRR